MFFSWQHSILILTLPFLLTCTGDPESLVDHVEDSDKLRTEGNTTSTPSSSGIGSDCTEGLKSIKITDVNNSGITSNSIQVGTSLNMKAGIFDADSNFLEPTDVYWSIQSSEFPTSNLSVTTLSDSAVFTPSVTGVTLIQASYDGSDTCVLKITDVTGAITVTSDKIIASLSLVSGDNQTATVNNALSLPLTVLAKDSFGDPLPGTQISFSVTGGNGSIVGSSTITTDIDGKAAVNFKAGCAAGANNIRATSADNGSYTVDFTSTGTVGSATQITFTTDPADAYASMLFGTQPAAAVQDSCGNTLTASTGNVALTVGSGSGAISGTTTVNLSSGVSTFTGLSYNTAEAVRLLATWSGSGSVTGLSSSFIVASQPAGSCAVNNATMNTLDGGCKDLTSGLVWSSLSGSTYNWHEAVWDSTLAGNAATDSGDFSRTNDYGLNELTYVPQSGTNTTEGRKRWHWCNGNCDNDATNYCHDLSEGGRTDWRLPTYAEFLELQTNTSSGISTYITGFAEVWTSSTDATSSASAMTVNGDSLTYTAVTKSTAKSVICVRAGYESPDRILMGGGPEESILAGVNSALWVYLADTNGSRAQIEGVTITLTASTGTLSGTTTAITDSEGVAVLKDWSMSGVTSTTLTAAATGYTSFSQALNIENSFPTTCAYDGDFYFTTADGGCKSNTSGQVLSDILYNQTWYEAIWDSTLAGNTAPDADDNAAVTEYDNNPGAYPDTSTTNYCHDLTEASKTNWRVPSIDDWHYLVIDTAYAGRSGASTNWYDYTVLANSNTSIWSSTTHTSNDNYAYYIMGSSTTSTHGTRSPKQVSTNEIICMRDPS